MPQSKYLRGGRDKWHEIIDVKKVICAVLFYIKPFLMPDLKLRS